MNSTVKIVGVVNVTPDSFSDGGEYFETSAAVSHALRLADEGAEIIEIGGDSTRPGSACCGQHEEWRRISPVLRELAVRMPVAVDTHQAETARCAVLEGAVMINDVGGGRDEGMLKALAGSDAKVVIMYSRCPRVHDFSTCAESDPVKAAKEYLLEHAAFARKCGVAGDQIVLDTGMGAFLGANKEDSWSVLRNYEVFTKLGFPLMLGVSRKGFLKLEGEQRVCERDNASALLAVLTAARLGFAGPAYLRAHNVKLHRHFFEIAAAMQ